jgi:hypothetical protein
MLIESVRFVVSDAKWERGLRELVADYVQESG